jgi:DNA-binding transcriptional LysR family regulator
MDISKYEIFLAVVDQGSYSRVSSELGYTPSALSKMMKSLETEAGMQLIFRSNKGISLTPEGERVIPLIRKMVRCHEELEEEYALIHGLEKGKVRIGCFPTIAFVWIPKIVAAFQDRCPNIQVEVTEENSVGQLEYWLSHNVIDVGVFSRDASQPFDWLMEKEDPYVVMMQKDHRLAEKPVLTKEDLSGAAFVQVSRCGRPGRVLVERGPCPASGADVLFELGYGCDQHDRTDGCGRAAAADHR